MSDLGETIYFWLAFGILVPVILSKFYFSKGKKRKDQLRLASLIFQLVTFVLLFFPWFEAEGIVYAGISLAIIGNLGLVIYGSALLLSMALVISGYPRLNVVGAKIALANSAWLFGVMFLMFPETKKLAFTDIAPIVSVLLMLCNNVVVLLLWHQLQKGEKKRCEAKAVSTV